MGYTSIGGKRIYGKHFNYGAFGATDIPRSIFRKNKDTLEEIEYNEQVLEKIFGVSFPVVKFKISEFWRVDFDTLIEIASSLGVNYIRSRKKPTDIEKRGIRKAILNKITN